MRCSHHASGRTSCIWTATTSGRPPGSRSGWRGTAGRFAAKRRSPTAGCSARGGCSTGCRRLRELAWLESRESQLALAEDGDPDRAHRHATEAIRVARAAGSIDYEMLGRSLQGLALVASGAVAEGMRLLDEVNTAIVAGELTDQIAIGLSSCYLIAACERVRDYDRAVQWCARLKAFCEKWGLRPLFAVCRTQYASICLWRGTWLEAEQELTAATGELAASRPAMTADGLVRLADLRRRQGRLVEASSLFEQAGHHPLAALGLAELAFDRGDARAAAESAERYLRRVPRHNRTDRVVALDLLVRALAANRGCRRRQDRAGRAPGDRRVVGDRAAAGGGEPRGGLRRARRRRWRCRTATSGGRGGSVPRQRRAVRAGARPDCAGPRARMLGRVGAAMEETQRALDLLIELHAELEISPREGAHAGLSATSGKPSRVQRA